MRILRRTLYAEAVFLAISGLAFAAAPKFALVRLFGQVRYPEYSWVRLSGIWGLGLALLAVLVAQRIEEMWWWAWAFALPTAAAALLLLLNAAFGVHCVGPQDARTCPAHGLWWGFAAVTVLLTVGFVVGLARSGQEAPPL